jgi:hypothetical protein
MGILFCNQEKETQAGPREEGTSTLRRSGDIRKLCIVDQEMMKI